MVSYRLAPIGSESGGAMRKRVSLERSITLSILSIGLLLATIGLLYAYWHAKTALRDTIGVTFQELARQSANNVSPFSSRTLSNLPDAKQSCRKRKLRREAETGDEDCRRIDLRFVSSLPSRNS
jgi:hypothetical protein